MRREFLVPDVGEGLEEATIVEWLVAPGTEVKLNQPLCLIETAKAIVELPSPYAGTITRCEGSVGDVLRVNELLAEFETADSTPLDETETLTATDRARDVDPEPTRTPTLVGYGADEKTSGARRDRSWRRQPVPSDGHGVSISQPGPARPLAKPPVRKLARALGIDLAEVTPTGPHGDITRDDIRMASTRHLEPLVFPGVPDRSNAMEIPMQGIRARIAQRMSLSRSTIPEATCGVWVDCAALLQLRDAIRPEMERSHPGTPVTPFGIIAWLSARALDAAPILNATLNVERNVIEVHDRVHLGIATSTDRGLVVPAIRDVRNTSLAQFSLALSQLAGGARNGTLEPAQLIGSTFTITNFGALGLDDGNPVINFPEVAILGVGSIRRQPAVHNDELTVRPLAKLICAFDHRVCDGADAGRFLVRLKQLIETPELTSLGD